MEIETVKDLSEKLADWIGIYGGCKSDGDVGCTYDKNEPFCCRQGFLGAMEERIRESVENEKKLESVGLCRDEVTDTDEKELNKPKLNMNMINKLKDLEEKYQVAMDWYYREKIGDSEYKEKIGEYVKYTPDDIVDEICNLIKKS